MNPLRILAIMHAPGEGLGRLEPVLAEAGARIAYVRMYRREPLPLFHHGYDAIISMGGPMNVYDLEHEWFFSREALFLRRAVESDVPVLGICLGSQMLARSLGARVVKAAVREVGFSKVSLTEAGRRDGLFRGVPASFSVLQWHEDTFELPRGAELLATGGEVERQGFRLRRAYGLQFHIEANIAILKDWVRDDMSLRSLLEEYSIYDQELERTVRTVGENFVSMVRTRGPGFGSEDGENEYAV